MYPLKKALEPLVEVVDDDVVAEHRIEELEILIERDGVDDDIASLVDQATDALAERDQPRLVARFGVVLDRLTDRQNRPGRSDPPADRPVPTPQPSDRPEPTPRSDTPPVDRPEPTAQPEADEPPARPTAEPPPESTPIREGQPTDRPADEPADSPRVRRATNRVVSRRPPSRRSLSPSVRPKPPKAIVRHAVERMQT